MMPTNAIKESCLLATEQHVKQLLAADTTGHDWWHIHRVRKLTLTLAKEEQADLFICEMAALLHDTVDDKLVADEKIAKTELLDWLFEQQLEENVVQQIMQIIADMSFKGGSNADKVLTLEGKVVQDADRIDALGAIGIARTMVYSGSKGRPMHLPNAQPRLNMTLAEYRNGEDTAIMHFYEKLLTLKDTMNTLTGKKLAEQRHLFLETYLEQFYAEWAGER